MAGCARRKMVSRTNTYGDYRTWAEHPRREIIQGKVYDMVPGPNRAHQRIALDLYRQFASFFKGKPCEVYPAPFDVLFPCGDQSDDEVDTVVQPDLVVVCDPEKLQDWGCRGAPDLVVEILSPSSASRDAILKRKLYEEHGVREYWMVDPINRLVHRFKLENDGCYSKPMIYTPNWKRLSVAHSRIFPKLAIDLREVFPPRDPDAR